MPAIAENIFTPMRRSQSNGCAGGGGGGGGAAGRRGGGGTGGGGGGAATRGGGTTTGAGGTSTGGGATGGTTGCAAGCGVSVTAVLRTSRSRFESSSTERCCCSSRSSTRRSRLFRPACETRLQIGRMNGMSSSRMPKKTKPSTPLSTSADDHQAFNRLAVFVAQHCAVDAQDAQSRIRGRVGNVRLAVHVTP